MLGVTTHISTDLAAIPLLWVLPLAAYLLTFILAFSTRGWIPEKFLAGALPLSALAVLLSIVFQQHAPWIISVHLIAFFFAALGCHTALVRSRPDARYLTEFYVWLSFGGMLGGVFNSLVAPQLFNGIFQYPIVLALACLPRSSPGFRRGRFEPGGVVAITAAVAFIVFVAAWGLGRFLPNAPLSVVLIRASIIPSILFVLANRTVVFNALVVLIALLIPIAGSGRTSLGELVFAGRSFFGVSRVIEGPRARLSPASARKYGPRSTESACRNGLRTAVLLQRQRTCWRPVSGGRSLYQRRGRRTRERCALVLCRSRHFLDLLRDRSALSSALPAIPHSLRSCQMRAGRST